MGNLVKVCNAGVPVPPPPARTRRWIRLAGVIAFIGGLSIELQRQRDGDHLQLVFLCRLGSESLTVDVEGNATFGVAAGCTLVVRAIAFRADAPHAVLVELQAEPGVLAGAILAVAA